MIKLGDPSLLDKKRVPGRYLAIWLYGKRGPAHGVLITTKEPKRVIASYQRYFKMAKIHKDKEYHEYGNRLFTMTNTECSLRHINLSVRSFFIESGYSSVHAVVIGSQPLSYTLGSRAKITVDFKRYLKSNGNRRVIKMSRKLQ